MSEEIIAEREYKDGEIVIKFSITKPESSDDCYFSYVIVEVEEHELRKYKIYGIDSLHCLVLSMVDCIFHIKNANSSSEDGLVFSGERDLGIPEMLLADWDS